MNDYTRKNNEVSDEEFYAISTIPVHSKRLPDTCTTMDERRALAYKHGYTAIGFYSVAMAYDASVTLSAWYAYR